ncbi:MAG: type II CAAX endopeptidase family protein [Candidatus Thermoplasmatota archaeon]
MVDHPAKKAVAKPAKPAKKVAPRTKGTPAKQPASRKVAKPAAPKRAAQTVPKSTSPPPRAPAPPAPLPPPQRATWAPATVWQPVQADWVAVPDPRLRPNAVGQSFNPATGAWLPAAPQADAPVVAADPAAYRRGATRSILLNVLLGIALALLGINFLLGLVVGIALVFAPDSGLSNYFEGESGIDSPLAFAVITLLTFVLVGLIPFLWVLGTRVRPWLGTRTYLQLRSGWKDWLRGVALVPAMILAVVVLSVLYILGTQGVDGLTNPKDDDTGDALLQNLTWPIAILVALCAGIGEEILFRGVLQKHIGVWGQAVAFGLAHAGNGYPPQVLFAFGLGVAFGFLFKRGWSLVSLIVAHALYDLTILGIALLYPELG